VIVRIAKTAASVRIAAAQETVVQGVSFYGNWHAITLTSWGGAALHSIGDFA
jgi:hypothetical protein